MANKKTILDALKILSAQFSHGRMHMTDEQMALEAALWVDEFKLVDDNIFNAAIREYIRSGEWFPRISQIYNLLNKFEDAAEGDTDWASAWDVLKRAISRYGTWGTQEELDRYFSEKLPPAGADDLRFVVQRLKFSTFCAMENDQEQANRANFRDVFTLAKKTRIERRRMHPDTLRIISSIAEKFSADRIRLNAAKDENEI